MENVKPSNKLLVIQEVFRYQASSTGEWTQRSILPINFWARESGGLSVGMKGHKVENTGKKAARNRCLSHFFFTFFFLIAVQCNSNIELNEKQKIVEQILPHFVNTNKSTAISAWLSKRI